MGGSRGSASSKAGQGFSSNVKALVGCPKVFSQEVPPACYVKLIFYKRQPAFRAVFSSGAMGSDSPLLAAVTLLSALHMGYLARQVGWSRIAHKIVPPSVTGPPEFQRTFRAHQNCVEFYPLFLVTLWTSGMFFSEVVAAAGGLVYMIARQMYLDGYAKSAKKRLPGFYLTLAVLFTLSALAFFGILRGILHKYFHVHF